MSAAVNQLDRGQRIADQGVQGRFRPRPPQTGRHVELAASEQVGPAQGRAETLFRIVGGNEDVARPQVIAGVLEPDDSVGSVIHRRGFRFRAPVFVQP